MLIYDTRFFCDDKRRARRDVEADRGLRRARPDARGCGHAVGPSSRSTAFLLGSVRPRTSVVAQKL